VRSPSLADTGRYDCIYVSPHAHDVPVSCAARILWEAGKGLRILVVTTCDSGAAPRTPVGLPVDHLRLGLRDATRRDPSHASFRSIAYDRRPLDDAAIAELAPLLEEIARRSRARHLYLPLAVGGHIDHRLVHEAALRVLHAVAGRDIFFYEERPDAFVPGAVHIRLGQLGVRLPPAALQAARGSGLAPFLFGFHTAPHVRAHLGGLVERFRCTGLATREWWQARAWNPQKAFGPRLQPVLHEGPAPDATRLAAWAGGGSALCGAGGRLGALASQYTRRLRRDAPHIERYWLLLPPREDGRVGLPSPGPVDPAA
jgi:LmbE family N-acetylglucosaminyl deacetylase